MKLWIYDLMSIQLLLLYMVKSPYDNNGCCIPCGYNWCETLNECV